MKNVFVFFFQAEDGIRDRDVTGVQTCALPISRSLRSRRRRRTRRPAPTGGTGARWDTRARSRGRWRTRPNRARARSSATHDAQLRSAPLRSGVERLDLGREVLLTDSPLQLERRCHLAFLDARSESTRLNSSHITI